jgi:hypothetical protein
MMDVWIGFISNRQGRRPHMEYDKQVKNRRTASWDFENDGG